MVFICICKIGENFFSGFPIVKYETMNGILRHVHYILTTGWLVGWLVVLGLTAL